jgi:hypothetical protein
MVFNTLLFFCWTGIFKSDETDARSPAEASVEVVLSQVHNRLSALQNSVNSTRTTVMDWLTNLCSDLMNHVQELNQHSRLELALQFAAVAASCLLKQTYTVTDRTLHQVQRECLAAQFGDKSGGIDDENNE